MKNIILLFIGLVFVSCSREVEVEVIDLSFYFNRESKTLSPNGIKTYAEVMEKIQPIICVDLQPRVIISLEKDELLCDKSTSARLIIQLINPCYENGVTCMKSGFDIRNDLIEECFRCADWRDDQLFLKLEKFFLENRRGVIAFKLNFKTSIEDFTKILKKVVIVFSQISEKHKGLKLEFVPHLMFTPPPSPPF